MKSSVDSPGNCPVCKLPSDVGLDTGLGIETGLETIYFEVSAVCRSRLFRPGLGLGLEAKVSVFWSRPARDLYYLL